MRRTLYSANHDYPVLYVFRTLLRDTVRVFLLDPNLYNIFQEVLIHGRNSDQLTVDIQNGSFASDFFINFFLENDRFVSHYDTLVQISTCLQRLVLKVEFVLKTQYDHRKPLEILINEATLLTSRMKIPVNKQGSKPKGKDYFENFFQNNLDVLALIILDMLPAEFVLGHEQHID